MDVVAGRTCLPRRVQGPGLELVGVRDDRATDTALQVAGDVPWRADALRVPDEARAFLERPGVAGVAPLLARDAAAGALVYGTGAGWSLPEVRVALRRLGREPGLRAALELGWRTAERLARAHAAGAEVGVPCHGAVDPWRLALRPDGDVVVLGYGVFPAALATREGAPGRAEALRHAPPERRAGEAEDARTDVFGLALIVAEWVLGAPLLEGDEAELDRASREGEADRRLFDARDRLPGDLRTVLGRALRPDREARFPDAAAFAEALRRELAGPHVAGPTLRQLVADLPVADRFLGLRELRAVVEEAAPASATPAAPRPRWVALGGRLGTARRAALAEPPPAASAPAPRAVEATPPPPASVVVALPGGREVDTLLPAGTTARDVLAAVGVRVALPTTDALGRIRYGWRLLRDGVPVRPGAAVEGPATLARVAARELALRVTLPGDGGAPRQVEGRFNAVVPVGAIATWTAGQLGVAPGDVVVRVGGAPLDPDDLLDGLVDDGGTVEIGT